MTNVLMAVSDKSLVRLFLSRIDVSVEVSLRSGCDREITAPALGCPSDLLESALLDGAVMFSVVDGPFWQVDSIGFHEVDSLLPNIWGQEDVGSLCEILPVPDRDPVAELQSRFSCVVCDGAFSSVTFQLNEWENILSRFAEAHSHAFEPNGGVVRPFRIRRSAFPLFEVRVREPELRFFFTPFDGEILLGGYFRKGHGSDEARQRIAQDRAGGCAAQRIRNFINNKS